MSSSMRLYRSLIDITNDYLGPAAPRFIDRQVRYHLKKEPETVAKEDLEQLISWLSVAMTMLTKDNKLVRQYTRSLNKLTD